MNYGFSIIFTRPETIHKSSQKSSQKIIELIKKNPKITILELSEEIYISDRAIKKNIKKLKNKNKLKRIGPDKGGHWEVIK